MRILLAALACLALVAAEAEYLKNFPKDEAAESKAEWLKRREAFPREEAEQGLNEEVGEPQQEFSEEEEEREEPTESVEEPTEEPTEEQQEEEVESAEEDGEEEEIEDVGESNEEEEEEEEEMAKEEKLKHWRHHRRHHRRPHHHRGGDRGRFPHRPRFCGRADCPRYRLMREYRGYELRCYPPQSWVTTKNDVLDSKDFGGMFKRLIAYIKGKNSRKQRLPMKKPVGVTMKYNITDHKTKSMMSFFLGESECCPRCDCHHGPPKPLDPKVFLMRTPLFCAYVRSFDGWVMSRSWSYYKQLWYLSKDLERDGKDTYYTKGLSGFAGYNPPWELFNRHNEVWRFFKCPKCQTEDPEEMFKYIQDEMEQETKPAMIP